MAPPTSLVAAGGAAAAAAVCCGVHCAADSQPPTPVSPHEPKNGDGGAAPAPRPPAAAPPTAAAADPEGSSPAPDAPPTAQPAAPAPAPPPPPAAAAAAGQQQRPAFGPGFAWDGATPLEDAPSQMFSLCLRWRRQAETLNAYKISKLEGVWARQTPPESLPDAAAGRQRLAVALLRQLLRDWDTSSQTAGLHPQAAAARTRKVDKLLAAVDADKGFAREAAKDKEERWRHSHAAEYLRFIEAQTADAQRTILRVTPLKHILTAYDRGSLIPGLWLEFGVAEGASLGLIASHVPAHMAAGVEISGGKVFGFDSFEGLPEDWRPGFGAGHFERRAGEPPSFAPELTASLELVPGWFEDSLPPFLAAHAGPVALLHLDSDVYSAAAFVLRCLLSHGRIAVGTIVVFDELWHYCGFESHEMLALFEVASLTGLEWGWVGVQQPGRMQAALVVTAVPPTAASKAQTALRRAKVRANILTTKKGWLTDDGFVGCGSDVHRRAASGRSNRTASAAPCPRSRPHPQRRPTAAAAPAPRADHPEAAARRHPWLPRRPTARSGRCRRRSGAPTPSFGWSPSRSWRTSSPSQSRRSCSRWCRARRRAPRRRASGLSARRWRTTPSRTR